MSQFVRWSCGCIGLQLDDRSLVIKSCDHDGVGPNVSLFDRDMTESWGQQLTRRYMDGCEDAKRVRDDLRAGERDRLVEKDSVDLDGEAVTALVREIRDLLHDGVKFREIKSLLS